MTSPAARPRRGAIVALDPGNPLASLITFQYNPSQLHRSLAPRTSGPEGDPSEALRLSGPPRESITLDAEIDAVGSASTGPGGISLGLHPTLAALEMLLYPKSVTILANAALSRLGVIEIVAPEAPLTLLVWGIKRVVPVRITSFSVREDAHDADLNPVLATVSLGMDVLTYQDLPPTDLGYGLFVAHQVAKEALATYYGVGSAADVSLPLSIPR